ncbi:hypothetical protein TNCV_4879691 [Trichonephila clavipes]|nr:hypothetical protein TNCV_4879691 [Trichonephila clavipes]
MQNTGFQMLSDDEIVTSVQEESDPVDDETDEDDDNNNSESSKGPSTADTFSALETAMEWYEQQSECYPSQLLLLKRIRDLFQRKNEVAKSGISCQMWDGIQKWEIVNPDDPDQDNGTKL